MTDGTIGDGHVPMICLSLCPSILFIIHDKSVKGSSSGSEYACNVGDAWDIGLVSWRRKMESHSRILAWEIPWTEEPGWLQSWGCKESDTTEQLNTYTHRCHIFSHIMIIGWTYWYWGIESEVCNYYPERHANTIMINATVYWQEVMLDSIRSSNSIEKHDKYLM